MNRRSSKRKWGSTMEIDARHTTAAHKPAHVAGGRPAGDDINRAEETRGGSPAFIIDLGPQAVSSGEGDEAGAGPAGPGKSAESPAHRARAFIAQFLALSEGNENPFKAFGQIVSQIARGRTFEQIFPATGSEESAGSDTGGEAGSAPDSTPPVPTDDPLANPTTEPAPTLLEVFAQQENQDGKNSTL